MIIATIVSHFARLHQLHKVIVVGNIKQGLPYPTMPSIEHVNQLIVPAITIAAVSLSISISMAKMFSRKHGYKVSSNQVMTLFNFSFPSILLFHYFHRNYWRTEFLMLCHHFFNVIQIQDL